MLNPTETSENIKDEYIDYLKTSFHMEDDEYAKGFCDALKKPGAVTKGPYLEVSDSYKHGATPLELIEDKELSPLFKNLEKDVPDEEREFQLERRLYLHQETAIRKINQSHNLIITTGTGSGKTECFVIPIINHLLREMEAGTLDAGVRAILIYPMNALANDQMKRFRALLKNYKDITFGVYNSSTEQTYDRGIVEYGKIYKDENGNPLEPMSNEIISRDDMRKTPPHILVTNYAMMEYMMLRPNDDAVFSGAKLRFLVLDEAHTYRGATGIETSILLKRLKARISNPENVLHILTSATLGDESCDDDIISFARNLCNVPPEDFDIIRSETVRAPYSDAGKDVDTKMFEALAHPTESVDDIAKRFGEEYPDEKSIPEYLYDLCLRSSLYRDFREVAAEPMTVPEIVEALKPCHPDIKEKDVVNLTAVASQASKNNTSLVKIRYHMFAKAIEGTYVTFGRYKNVLLDRNEFVDLDESGKIIGNGDKDTKAFDTVRAFECAVCDECGRIAIYGRDENGRLKFANGGFDKSVNFYFVYKDLTETLEDIEKDNSDIERDEQSDQSDAVKIGRNDYMLCSKCGAITHASGATGQGICVCGKEYLVKVRKVVREGKKKKTDEIYDACPACLGGRLHTFYAGYDAVTSVLGTALFDELPEEEKALKRKEKASSLFDVSDDSVADTKANYRQFLTFSDSRGDAAFFASYMSASYNEFLRRRGMLRVIDNYREDMERNPWQVKGFVDRLNDYFYNDKTFIDPEDENGSGLTVQSEKNAWIAVLNEMKNSARSTSLTSLGFLKFDNNINALNMFAPIAKKYNRSREDVKALFDLLIMDVVSFGAFETDYQLKAEDREYIYFSAVSRRVKDCRDPVADKGKSQIMSWTASKSGKGYRMNGRLKRVMVALGIDDPAEANEVLLEYWKHILCPKMAPDKQIGGYYLPTNALTICGAGGSVPVYKCSRCGKVTTINCENRCPVLKCGGRLEIIDPKKELQDDNHFVNLYRFGSLNPFHIKEHTAQLGREEQKDYQELFVEKKINALSCSTTFEMGVDVGDLETIYMRNVPPTPANYVQRAGRAGRGNGKAAFSLTFAKLGSHDFTFYRQPEDMITGKIGVPFFTVDNDKVVQRHIYAVALSSFFAKYPEAYNHNDADVFLNGKGWVNFCDYLKGKPKDLRDLLKRSVPLNPAREKEIESFAWTDKLIGDGKNGGETGILTEAVQDYYATVNYYKTELDKANEEKRYGDAEDYDRKLKNYRRSTIEGDHVKATVDLIEFFVRNNVLPKYGFPVDTVELHRDLGSVSGGVQMTRDLQLAVSEYAPSSQIVADGFIYTSRYIRRTPPKVSKNTSEVEDTGFETVYVAECLNCGTWNLNPVEAPSVNTACISCGAVIIPDDWNQAIEPRMGFVAEPHPKVAGMTNPKKKYAGKFSYIGNPQIGRNIIDKHDLIAKDGTNIHIETSRNDSLMRVCNDDFYVCPSCGYAESGTENISKKDYSSRKKLLTGRPHPTPWGRDCKCDELKRNKLCHIFKTDVVSIRFYTSDAETYDTMLSVMYALLEAMAAEFDIERNDISGCLYVIKHGDMLINSIILYDTVAGGAGHVRRLVTEDGKVFTGESFMRIARKAMDITGNCTCSPSCYNCLRNYGNSDVHDLLDRRKAYAFLDRYCKDVKLMPKMP